MYLISGKYLPATLFILAIIFAFLLFQPALHGPFFIDDIVHLSKLSGGGAVTDWESFLKFVFSGTSASGRPLSYLSMLIESPFYISDSYLYKRNNLFIHMLNACLVFWLVLLIARESSWAKNPQRVALFAFLIWLLHPIQLSTMMLVIQRMTLLMATFNLVGLIIYMKGRKQFIAGAVYRGGILMTLGVGFAGVVGALAKDPGVLVAAYVLIIEYFFIKNKQLLNSKFWKIWSGAILWSVLALLLILVFYWVGQIEHLFLKRDFTAGERVLTEFRVLLDYLHSIVAPQIGNIGPFHDDYVPSKSLLNPLSTLASIIILLAIVGLAIKYRKVCPPMLAGVLWFFAGHSLEASPLPIELYFEHRNYMPMIGLCIAFAWLFGVAIDRWGKRGYIVPSLYYCFIVFMSYQSSLIWGNHALQSQFWLHYHPKSWRTSASLMSNHLTAQRYDEAIKEADRFSSIVPNNAGPKLLKLIVQACGKHRALSETNLNDLLSTIKIAEFEHASVPLIKKLTDAKNKKQCAALSEETVVKIISAYLDNPKFRGVPNAALQLYLSRSILLTHLGDFPGVMADYNSAFELSPKYQLAVNQAILSLSAGRIDLAEEALDKVDGKYKNLLLKDAQDRSVSDVRELIEEAKRARFNTDDSGKGP